MLVNDGTEFSRYITVPFDPGPIENYAVEAEIQFTGLEGRPHSNCFDAPIFGIAVRAEQDMAGYFGGVYVGNIGSCMWPNIASILYLQDALDDQRAGIADRQFTPGDSWHTYRIEVSGNQITLLIDGAKVVDVTDNRFLSGGGVGLYTNAVQIDIRSFKMIAL